VQCPRLDELPPPPPGKIGWPWTVETPPLPPARPDGSPWPRISIVTPSYDQGQFIEETIRSVLLQAYPDLEYIIVDGGSTDASLKIIEKYAPWLTYWISEPDRGQAHAINKGLAHTTGALFNWINSDDLLFPSALSSVAAVYRIGYAIAGSVVNHGIFGRRVIPNGALSFTTLLEANPRTSFHQPGLWLERQSLMAIGGIDERLHYSFDWDLMLRYLESFPDIFYIGDNLVYFRQHPNSKTVQQERSIYTERQLIRARLVHSLKNPINRLACRKALQRINWERHLTGWRKGASGIERDVAMKILLLAVRRPRLRISRFSVGALRRTIFR
jgi:glycosyltransferase involved in cell wall biosynthesis